MHNLASYILRMYIQYMAAATRTPVSHLLLDATFVLLSDVKVLIVSLVACAFANTHHAHDAC